jgi:hypothetical protein
MADLFLKSNTKWTNNTSEDSLNISNILLNTKSKNNLKNNYSATSADNTRIKYGGNNNYSATSVDNTRTNNTYSATSVDNKRSNNTYSATSVNNKRSNNTYSAISANNIKTDNLSATSVSNYNFIRGGGKNTNSSTSSENLSKINSKDINNLVSMLTSESENNTNTDDLQNKLTNLLNKSQNGGSNDEYVNTEVLENKLKNIINKTQMQGGGSSYDENTNTEILENKINNIINSRYQSGGSVDKSILTLGSLGLASVFIANHNKNKNKKNTNVTDSELNISNILNNSNKPLPKVVEEPNNKFSDTSSDVQHITNTTTDIDNDIRVRELEQFNINEIPSIKQQPQIPESKEAREAREKREDQEIKELVGGELSPGMVVYGKISKLVAEKLSIPNGRNCKKIAGQLYRDVKEKNPSVAPEKLLNLAKEHLDKNLNKYKKINE